MFGKRPVVPVVYRDRQRKAKMIESILGNYLDRSIEGFRILDIGCGNGDISTYFASHNDQYGVDVKDQRRDENHGFQFSRVVSEQLPYEDDFFDIVISHHVIEHVEDQELHLSEIRRCLKKNGNAYLATPNKTSPLMRGHIGNEQVLHYRQIEPLLKGCGFNIADYSVRVVKQPDHYYCDMRSGRFVPAPLVKLMRPFIPSHIYMLRPDW
jgi:2-polyprenyl-3-methyl-5-hydroxy-6-metoxy-1,4-benzoquinol methylase